MGICPKIVARKIAKYNIDLIAWKRSYRFKTINEYVKVIN